MLTTCEKLFCEALDRRIPELADIDVTFRERGVEAAEKQLADYIRASFDKDFSLEDVAAFVGVNKCYLSREFHKYTGYTFVAYVNRTRCKMAQRLLLDGGLSIREVGERCGFESPSYFSRTYKKLMGKTPSSEK